MDDPHLVVAVRSHGFDASTVTFHDGPDAALAEVEYLRGLGADDTVTFRAFRLVEVRRGHVPANEQLDMDEH